MIRRAVTTTVLAFVVGFVVAVGIYITDQSGVEGSWVNRSPYSPTVYLEVGEEKVKYFWIDRICTTGSFRVDSLSRDSVKFGGYTALTSNSGVIRTSPDRMVVRIDREEVEYMRSRHDPSELCKEINTRTKTTGRWTHKDWTGIHPNIVSME